MDQFAQTNDLQKAIETVANGNSAVNNDVAQFGIPPMPPMPENGNTMPEVKPLVPVEDTAAPSAEQILSQGMGTEAMPPAVDNTVVPDVAAPDEAVAAPVAPETPEAPVPSNVEAAPAENLSDVKQNILKDLLPLLDKTGKTPEEKFEIYKDALETMHDVKTIEGAYKTATQISDEVKKAEALFDVMKVIDTQ
ncbi:hypothetical protein IJI64_01650 [Candidatus Saccharibacteria bacterium]|nr:hypothetical protein [Candidatus Saccharibacteria bacterium]